LFSFVEEAFFLPDAQNIFIRGIPKSTTWKFYQNKQGRQKHTASNQCPADQACVKIFTT
jgi:hypothetical protein